MPKTKLEIYIQIDTNEEQDDFELLEMFKTMCSYSGCVFSTSSFSKDKEQEVQELKDTIKKLDILLYRREKENQELKTYIKLLADKKKLQEDKELLELMETKLGKREK